MAGEHENKGARSLVWIREQIDNLKFTDHPITTILEVTGSIEKKGDEDVPRNLMRDLYIRIGRELTNKMIMIGPHPVTMRFRKAREYLVHHISDSTLLDNVKILFMERYITQLNSQLLVEFPLFNISFNYLLSNPMVFIEDPGDDFTEELDDMTNDDVDD